MCAYYLMIKNECEESTVLLSNVKCEKLGFVVSKKILLVLMIGLSFQLVGCGSNVKPQPSAPVVERPTTPVPKPEIVVPVKPQEPAPPQQVTPQTQPQPVLATSNAVASLVSQARMQYQAKNYAVAVATAERALKIDRRSPEVYLILAQSYVQLANTQLAQQFVQQGIRYSQAGSDVAQSLLKLRDALPH